MTRVQFDIVVPRRIEEVYDFVADFRNLPDWDPGIARAEQIEGTGVETGAAYRVVSSFAGRELELVYRTTAADRPSRAVLVGEGGSVRAVDEIRFEPSGGGTRIRYTADFTLKGLLAPIGPFMKPAFERLAARARDGLVARLED